MKKPNLTLKKTVGLGDKVERIAKPIAKGIDRMLGTKIEHCKSCKKRKDYLNQLTK